MKKLNKKPLIDRPLGFSLFFVFIFFTFKTYAQLDSITNSKVEIKDDVCLNVIVETDKFTGNVSYNTPEVQNISFMKYKTKGITNQYVSIDIYDSYLSSHNNKGLIILFKSGKKIDRVNEKIDLHSSTGSNWRYSVFFTPTINEINLLKTEEIIGIKLYIFNVDINEGNLIKDYANCFLITPKSKTPIKKSK